MPSVTYSRLDGSVPAGQRQSVVQRYLHCDFFVMLGEITCFLYGAHSRVDNRKDNPFLFVSCVNCYFTIYPILPLDSITIHL